jgi:hypothetical protein
MNEASARLKIAVQRLKIANKAREDANNELKHTNERQREAERVRKNTHRFAHQWAARYYDSPETFAGITHLVNAMLLDML